MKSFDLVKSETGITPQSVVQRGSKMVVGIVGAEEKERVFQLLDRERIMGGGMVSVKREASILLASDRDLLMKRRLTRVWPSFSNMVGPFRRWVSE